MTASETEEGRLWAEWRIKQLTGGDTIAARFMRRDFFIVPPQSRGNHPKKMAITRKLWSINALAIELNIDRRTVAARLEDVPADGKNRGHPAWRLTTALAACGKATSPKRHGDAAELPPGMACLARLPKDTGEEIAAIGFVVCAIAVMVELRYLTALAIMHMGGNAVLAEKATGFLAVAMIDYLQEQGGEFGIAESFFEDGWIPWSAMKAREPIWAELDAWIAKVKTDEQ